MDLKKIVVPLIVVALLVAAAFTWPISGRRGDEDAHRALPADRLDLRGQRRPRARRADRHRRHRDPVGHRRRRHHVVRRQRSRFPTDAAAVIVSPSIVGDRFVQLTPVYTDGPVLDDGATLQADRTAVPLELDQIYESLDDLTVALGPNGANAKGALTDLLETTAANFGGQGAKFHQTIQDFSQLTGTLDDNKEELFGSAEALEGFIKTLARNDKTVRQFNQSLASVSQMLAGERTELAASLRNLAVAMKQVSGFVKENREILGSNIKGLNRVAKVLVKQRGALDEILSAAPVALNNLALTYNPQAGTLDTRANIQELGHQIASDPATLLCGIVNQADQAGQVCDVIKDILKDLPAAPRVAALGQAAGGVREPEQFDPTLGGLVAPDEPAARCESFGVVPGRSGALQRSERPGYPLDRVSTAVRRSSCCCSRSSASLTISGCGFDVYKLPLPGGTDVGRRPDHRAHHVPRRPRPGAAVDGEGQRRQRRQGDRRQPRRVHRRRDGAAAQGHRAARQRRGHDPADQPAGREVRLAGPARVRRQQRAASERGRDPARAQRPQPRGRGGPRCPQPAAQRRRRGPAAHHRPRAQHRARGPRGYDAVGARPDPHADDPARRPQGRHRQRHRQAQHLAVSVNEQRDTIDAALEELPSALVSIDKQRDDLVKMLEGARGAERRRRPGDPGVQGGHHRLAAAAQPRCCRRSPRQATTSSTPSTCS